jgi:hypothetical protein
VSPGLEIYALDAEGRRLDLDALAYLFTGVLGARFESIGGGDRRELFGDDSIIAAYELTDGDGPPHVLPVSMGLVRIGDVVVERMRKVLHRRGPARTGPEPGPEVLRAVALYWLEAGRPPTQTSLAEHLGYSEPSAFRRAIRGPIGWRRLKVLALLLLDRAYDRQLAQVDEGSGLTLDQARQLQKFERIFERRQRPRVSPPR